VDSQELNRLVAETIDASIAASIDHTLLRPEATAADIPDDLEKQVRAVLAEHADLRWDDAIQIVLDETQLSRVLAEKERAKKKSGDFTSNSDIDDVEGGAK